MTSNVKIPKDYIPGINEHPHLINVIMDKAEIAVCVFQDHIMDEKSGIDILKNGDICRRPTFGRTFLQKVLYSKLLFPVVLIISMLPTVVAFLISFKMISIANLWRRFQRLQPIVVLGITILYNKTECIVTLKMLGLIYSGLILWGVMIITAVKLMDSSRLRILNNIIANNHLRDTLGRRNPWWNTKAGEVFYKELCSSNSEPIKALDENIDCVAFHADNMSDEEHRKSAIHAWHSGFGFFYALIGVPCQAFFLRRLCPQCIRVFCDWQLPRTIYKEPPQWNDVQNLVLAKDPGEIWCLIRNKDDWVKHIQQGDIIHIRGKLVRRLDDSMLLDPSIDVSDRTKFPVIKLMVHPVKMDPVRKRVMPITKEEIAHSLAIDGI